MYWIDGDFLNVTVHDFKNNVSKYLRMLEREHYRGVVIYRRNKRVALVQAIAPYEREAGGVIFLT